MSEKSMKQRMLDGELYLANEQELVDDHARAVDLCHQINTTHPNDRDTLDELYRELLGEYGEGATIRPPFRCDYGYQTHFGAGSFANFGLIILDVAEVRIGKNCQIATNVQLLTATHPLEPGPRRDGWESGEPITIEDNVWLGGGVIVCPGVTIGENTVVGAGSVVAKDLPANVIAVGNPAKPIRPLPGD